MTAKLFVSAIAKFALGVALIGVLLFLPAGTLHYPQGWLLMGILFIPMFLAGLVMMAKNPALLQSRLNAKEKEQSLVLGSALAFLVFLAYPAIIVKRIRNEEDVLTAELPGYAAYKQKVKWRLIPFIW